jgi:hypothetical protein
MSTPTGLRTEHGSSSRALEAVIAICGWWVRRVASPSSCSISRATSAHRTGRRTGDWSPTPIARVRARGWRPSARAAPDAARWLPPWLTRGPRRGRRPAGGWQSCPCAVVSRRCAACLRPAGGRVLWRVSAAATPSPAGGRSHRHRARRHVLESGCRTSISEHLAASSSPVRVRAFDSGSRRRSTTWYRRPPDPRRARGRVTADACTPAGHARARWAPRLPRR